MILDIEHRVRYRYSAAVSLEPLTLRLTPRGDAAQRLVSFALQIEPRPSQVTDCLDIYNNVCHSLYFSGTQDLLAITSRSRVETFRANPYDFLLHDAALLPFRYPLEDGGVVAPYLRRPQPSPAVDELSRAISDETRGATLEFITGLTRRIHRLCENEFRETGEPRAPSETLGLARGSCRDLVVLWMDACRVAGLAARFVSGYKLGEGDDAEHHLHAWGEIYLPGAGWRGFDPSTGLACADLYVAVAAAPSPEHAAPQSGTYRGDARTEELQTQVSVEQIGPRLD